MLSAQAFGPTAFSNRPSTQTGQGSFKQYGSQRMMPVVRSQNSLNFKQINLRSRDKLNQIMMVNKKLDLSKHQKFGVQNLAFESKEPQFTSPQNEANFLQSNPLMMGMDINQLKNAQSQQKQLFNPNVKAAFPQGSIPSQKHSVISQKNQFGFQIQQRSTKSNLQAIPTRYNNGVAYNSQEVAFALSDQFVENNDAQSNQDFMDKEFQFSDDELEQARKFWTTQIFKTIQSEPNMSYKMFSKEILMLNYKTNPNGTEVYVSQTSSYHNGKWMQAEDMSVVCQAMRMDLSQIIQWEKYEKVVQAFPQGYRGIAEKTKSLKKFASNTFEIGEPVTVSDDKAVLKIVLEEEGLQQLAKDQNENNIVMQNTNLLVKKLSLISDNFEDLKKFFEKQKAQQTRGSQLIVKATTTDQEDVQDFNNDDYEPPIFYNKKFMEEMSQKSVDHQGLEEESKKVTKNTGVAQNQESQTMEQYAQNIMNIKNRLMDPIIGRKEYIELLELREEIYQGQLLYKEECLQQNLAIKEQQAVKQFTRYDQDEQAVFTRYDGSGKPCQATFDLSSTSCTNIVPQQNHEFSVHDDTSRDQEVAFVGQIKNIDQFWRQQTDKKNNLKQQNKTPIMEAIETRYQRFSSQNKTPIATGVDKQDFRNEIKEYIDLLETELDSFDRR